VSPPARIGRRGLLAGGLAAGAALACGPARADQGWHDIDMTGISAPLRFTMSRATDGKTLTAKSFRGEVTLLYFGYTFCPDICPLTLGNVVRVLGRLGKQAQDVRLLFVTVDPNRDTLPVLKQYAAAFAPEVVGLRGTPDALTALARRYRIAYSVTPPRDGHPYEVTHSSAMYVFDRSGTARLLVPSLASPKADLAGVADDLRRLLAERPPSGPVAAVEGFVRGLL
jgi:protein SCO1/2